jgi:hypothetical protein
MSKCFWCEIDGAELSLLRAGSDGEKEVMHEIWFHRICALNAIARLAERCGGSLGATQSIRLIDSDCPNPMQPNEYYYPRGSDPEIFMKFYH